MKNTFYSAVFMVGVYTNVVFASPTANEFNKCTELESAYVASCLRANDKNCLIKAAEVKKRCINQVIQQHNRNSPERKARQAAQIRQAQFFALLPVMRIIPAADITEYCAPPTPTHAKQPLEKKQLRVSSFQIAEHETTVAQFRFFIEDSGYVTDAEKNAISPLSCESIHSSEFVPSNHWRAPGYTQTEQHPVVCISYTDVQAYIQWLNKKIDRLYRLPTADEWIHAYGDAADSLNGTESKNNARPVAVKSFPANTFNLFDMQGNVAEWTSSCSDLDCNKHHVVGGSFLQPPQKLDGCDAIPADAQKRNFSIGFRLAMDAPSP